MSKDVFNRVRSAVLRSFRSQNGRPDVDPIIVPTLRRIFNDEITDGKRFALIDSETHEITWADSKEALMDLLDK